MPSSILVWEQQNTTPVCYKAKGDEKGEFTIQNSGTIEAFKLEHVTGLLGCRPTGCDTYWGLYPANPSPFIISTAITDTNRNVVSPSPNDITSNDFDSFSIPGYDHMSPEIVMKAYGTQVRSASKGNVFWIWFAEDLFDTSESNNVGEICVNVYAKFKRW